MAEKKSATDEAVSAAQEQVLEAIEQGQAMMAKAHEQVVGAIEQGQAMMLKGYEAIVDAVDKLDIPKVPGADKLYEARADMFDSLFDFGTAVLESQRNFTRQVLDAAAKTQKD